MSNTTTNHQGLAEVYRLAATYDAPEFVKNASVADLEGEPGVAYSGQYLNPMHQQYPVHTKVATWASAAQYYEKAALSGERNWVYEERFKELGDHYRMRGELNALKTNISNLVKSGQQQLTDDDYALVKKAEDGSVRRMYPLRDSAEVKLAEQYLLENVDNFQYQDRQKFARSLIKKADEFGYSFQDDERIARIAGHGATSSSELADALLHRAHIVKLAGEDLEQIQALAASVRDAPAVTSNDEMATKMAVFIDQFDRKHLLNRQYRLGLPRPEDTVYAVPRAKIATVKQDLTPETKTGNVYNRHHFSKIALEELDRVRPGLSSSLDWGGVRVDVEKLAAAIPELSYSEAKALDYICKKSGVDPELSRELPEVIVTEEDRLPDLEKAAASYQRPKAQPGSLFYLLENAPGQGG